MEDQLKAGTPTNRRVGDYMDEAKRLGREYGPSVTRAITTFDEFYGRTMMSQEETISDLSQCLAMFGCDIPEAPAPSAPPGVVGDSARMSSRSHLIAHMASTLRQRIGGD